MPPVLQLGGEVDGAQVRPAARPARTAHRVGHPGAGAQPVHARPSHRARHVDHERTARARTADLQGRGRPGPRGDRSVTAPRVEDREHREAEQREAAEEELARGELGHAAKLGGIP